MVWILCSMFILQCAPTFSDENKQEKYFKNLLSIEGSNIEIYKRNNSTYQQIPLLIIKKHENSN
ncbi:MAG: hypothetical protein CBD16_09510 [Betaproteobacteria bacterium TMED156]|nr:MAG: hypothetical protein CBD16_09510 [Betaproteobacteria bacterium TMED156]